MAFNFRLHNIMIWKDACYVPTLPSEHLVRHSCEMSWRAPLCSRGRELCRCLLGVVSDWLFAGFPLGRSARCWWWGDGVFHCYCNALLFGLCQKSVSGHKETIILIKVSQQVKTSDHFSKCRGASTGTGSTLCFYSNTGGDWVFPIGWGLAWKSFVVG